MISIENEYIVNLKYDDVIENFASKNVRKSVFFNWIVLIIGFSISINSFYFILFYLFIY